MNEKTYLGKLFVTPIIALVFLCFGFVITPVAKAKPFKSSMPTVVDPGYKIQILVPGSYFHGIHGLTFDSQDNLYAGSVVGQSIYHVDTDTGDVSVFIGPPNGMADDLEFGPDGRIYYTSFLMGKVHAKGADGKVTVLAEGLPGINSLAFNQEGKERTVVAKDLIVPIYLAPAGPDGVYVTEAMAGTVSRIDLSNGEKKVVASGLRMPEGIAVFPDGKLAVVETGTRQLLKIDPASGAINPLVINLSVGFPSYPGGLPPYLITGVAVSDSGTIYVTGDLENVLYKILPQ